MEASTSHLTSPHLHFLICKHQKITALTSWVCCGDAMHSGSWCRWPSESPPVLMQAPRLCLGHVCMYRPHRPLTSAHEHQTCKPGHTGVCGTDIKGTCRCANRAHWCGHKYTDVCTWEMPRLLVWHMRREHWSRLEPSLAPTPWVSSSRLVLGERTEPLPPLPTPPRCTSRMPRSREGWPWGPPQR